MSITFRDFNARNFLCHLEPVAGLGGLDNSITTANILDYEFSVDLDIENPFDSECVIVSSLYFAAGRESLLLPTVRRLNYLGASGLIYETAIYKTLPPEVIKYADENDFPVFRFDRPLGLENVVYDIIDAVHNSDAIQLSEAVLDQAIWNTLNAPDAFSIINSLSLKFRRYLRTTYITRTNDIHKIDYSVIFNKFHTRKSRKDNYLIISYREGVFLFSTMDSNDRKKFDVMTEIILEDLLPDDAEIILAHSDIHESESEFYTCLQEAYFSSIVARINKSSSITYNDIGLYRLIIPQKDDRTLLAFADDIIAALQTDENLLSTVSDFLAMDGNINEVAEAQRCHPNTIRHRIKKAKDITGYENTSYFDFISAMSIAVHFTRIKGIR